MSDNRLNVVGKQLLKSRCDSFKKSKNHSIKITIEKSSHKITGLKKYYLSTNPNRSNCDQYPNN